MVEGCRACPRHPGQARVRLSPPAPIGPRPLSRLPRGKPGDKVAGAPGLSNHLLAETDGQSHPIKR